jgi:excinuclease ABC subunit C
MVFQGRNDELLDLLDRADGEGGYAERLDFESAATGMHDQLQGIGTLAADQKMSVGDGTISRDVIALACDAAGGAGVQVFPDAGRQAGGPTGVRGRGPVPAPWARSCRRGG